MAAQAQQQRQSRRMTEEQRLHKAKFVDMYLSQEAIERSNSFSELAPLVENMNERYTYEVLQQLKGGTFSEVSKVRCRATDQQFAMKSLVKRSVDNSIPKSLLNELLMVYDLEHRNIVKFRTCCSHLDEEGHTRFHLIFELCAFDLGYLLFQSKALITVENRKTLAYGLLSGLQYMHSKHIIHRDLKPCNLLITEGGCLRIADLGQATYIGDRCSATMSCHIGTPGYVAPEILFGAPKYGAQVDIWSAGIIIAEMFMRKKFIHGRERAEQIAHISAVLGTINEEVWPNCEKLPLWRCFQGEIMMRGRGRLTDSLYNYAYEEKEAGAMIRRMLRLCPSKRCTLSSARCHDWFQYPPFAAQSIEDCLERLKEGIRADYLSSSDDEPPMW